MAAKIDQLLRDLSVLRVKNYWKIFKRPLCLVPALFLK